MKLSKMTFSKFWLIFVNFKGKKITVLILVEWLHVSVMLKYINTTFDTLKRHIVDRLRLCTFLNVCICIVWTSREGERAEARAIVYDISLGGSQFLVTDVPLETLSLNSVLFFFG